jgi:hypothetical protein
MTGMGEELGRDSQITQSGWGLCWEAFFSGAVESIQLCWVSVKGCRVQYVMGTYVSCVSDLSYKMYIYSNYHDSWI